MDPLALVCSVGFEAEPLLRSVRSVRHLPGPTITGWEGVLGNRTILAVTTGMGKTNAARGLTALLESLPVAGVIGFGIAGAYAGSGLSPGDVAIAEVEHYGDEGVDTPDGWLSCEGIGIPLLETRGLRMFNAFPVDANALRVVAAAAERSERNVRRGAFVTVSNCSGTAQRGAELESRYGAICETMEGAAYAHVAAFYGVPFAEIRGISNLVEDRDTSRWRLAHGAEAAAEVLALSVASWPYHDSP